MVDKPTEPKDIQVMLDALRDVSQVMFSTMSSLDDVMRRFETTVTGVRKGFESIGTDARKTVSYIDSWRGSLQDIQRLSEHVRARGLFKKDTTLQEAKKTLTEIMALAKRVSNEPDYGRKNINKAKTILGEVEDLLKRVDKQVAKAGGSWDVPLKNVDKFSRSMKDVSFDIEIATEKMRKQGGVVGTMLRLFDQYAGKAGIYSRIGEAFEARNRKKAERREEFQRRAAIPANAVNRLVSGLQFNEEGKLDIEYLKRLRGPERRRLIQAAREVGRLSPDELRGYTTKLGGGRGAVKGVGTVAGQIAATAGRAAIGVTPEAAETLEAAAAGGMGGLEGIITSPWTAGIAGIAVVLEQLFDRWAASNKEIYTKLGVGSILAGSRSVVETFQNVRENLTPGIYSTFGVTYSKNLAMAEAITKFGINVGELAEANNDLRRNIVGGAGMAEARGRGIGYTAYGVAKLTGLDEVQTTERILRLITQYHQSLGASDTFFQNIISDTKAAGITTTKYLEIIDSISDRFGHMARSIETVTGMLRILGHTGTMSAEELQDAMGAMIGPEKTHEQRAFLVMQMAQNEEFRKRLLPERMEEVASGAEKVRQALRGAGVPEAAIGALGNLQSQDVKEASDALARANDLQATLPESLSPVLREALGGAIKEQQFRLERLATTQQLNQPGGMGAVNYAFQIAPQDVFQKTMDNLQALVYILSKAGIGGAERRGHTGRTWPTRTPPWRSTRP